MTQFFNFIALFLTINTVINSHAYSQQSLSEAMEAVRDGNYFDGIKPFQEQMINNPEKFIQEASAYLSDTVSSVNAFALDIVHETARLNEKAAIKRQAVEHLVFGISDSQSEIAGKAADYLKTYNRNDFTPLAKDSLQSYLTTVPFYKDKIVLLLGYLRLNAAIPAIELLLGSPNTSDKEKWACRLALSRLGNSEQTNAIVRIMDSRPKNNTLIHNMVPDLIYTRQKEAFNYLVTIIQSDAKECFSSNPDNYTELPCAYRVMEYMAPVVEGYPVEHYDGIRQLKADNYTEALKTIRVWFETNPDFKIVDVSY